MRITTQAWETYIRRLAQLNEKAAQLMAEYLAAHGIADTEALTDYAAALVQKYGEGSAELACQMYDAMAALQNARVSPAEPAAPASRREVARMVQATRESPPQMQRGVSRLVKRAGADTTLKNAQRDGAEFAWVPHGDSCAFCLTLASRGWQRASQAAIKGGHAEHIHASCDCEYAVRFDGRTSVAGYDPEAYPLFFDSEWGHTTKTGVHDGRADNLTKAQRTACARAFCVRAAALGYQPGVYTFTSFATANIDYEGLCKDYIGWLADTRTNYDKTLPRHIHQYSQTAKGGMAGITGAVDLNHLVKALPAADKPANKLQVITVGPVSQGDADAVFAVCQSRGLTDAGLYKSEWAEV